MPFISIGLIFSFYCNKIQPFKQKETCIPSFFSFPSPSSPERYHSIKFFERQKLTRMERKTLKCLNEAKAAADFDDVAKYKAQLQEICMDELYVAYFPNTMKYIALFAKNGKRIVDDDNERISEQRRRIRNDVLDKVKNGNIDCTKSWVNMEYLNLEAVSIGKTNTVIDSGGTRDDCLKESKVDIDVLSRNMNEKEENNSGKYEAKVHLMQKMSNHQKPM